MHATRRLENVAVDDVPRDDSLVQSLKAQHPTKCSLEAPDERKSHVAGSAAVSGLALMGRTYHTRLESTTSLAASDDL